MKISRFANNPDSTPLHSNGMAGDGAPAPQSFTERQQLERHRQTIQAYQQSLVGSQLNGRGQISPKKRSKLTNGPTVPTRQEFNAQAPATGFKEPPARGYNPYS
jgi:hypothetical protein